MLTAIGCKILRQSPSKEIPSRQSLCTGYTNRCRGDLAGPGAVAPKAILAAVVAKQVSGQPNLGFANDNRYANASRRGKMTMNFYNLVHYRALIHTGAADTLSSTPIMSIAENRVFGRFQNLPTSANLHVCPVRTNPSSNPTSADLLGRIRAAQFMLSSFPIGEVGMPSTVGAAGRNEVHPYSTLLPTNRMDAESCSAEDRGRRVDCRTRV